MARRGAPAAPPPLPRGRSPAAGARRLGAVALALLVLLALPAIVLALRYVPDPALAHDAVAATDAGPLRFARGAHAWAASFTLALVALHLARAYAAGRIEVPGRGAGLAGLAAFAALVGAYFTGTILPWDQQGWEALQHLREGAAALGVPLGPDEPGEAPLRVLFLAHVLAVPAALAALLAMHLRRAGAADDARRVGRLLRESWLPVLLVAVAVHALALLLPPALGPAPIEGLSVTKPDWPFLWLVPLQDWLGPVALLALPLAFVAAGALLWRRGTAGPRARRVVLVVVSGGWLALTLLGLR